MRTAPLLTLLSVLPLSAGGWPALDPSVWAIRADPGRGIRDAVILEKSVRFDLGLTDYHYLVRILDEAGKRAAEFPVVGNVHQIEGRTVTPDGKEAAFSGAKDCQTTRIRVGDFYDRKVTVLIPPGVTSDCVVEVRFRLSGYPGSGEGKDVWWWMTEEPFAGRYFTRRASAALVANARFPWGWYLTGNLGSPVESRDGAFRVVTCTDIPASGDEPFSLPAVEGYPVMTVHTQASGFERLSNEEFWSHGMGALGKDWFEVGVKRGRAFDGFVGQTCKGLEGLDAQQRAAAVFNRLQAAWRNVDRLTDLERASRPVAYGKSRVDPRDLETAAQHGETDDSGMAVALFHLLRATGIQPKVGMVADRSRRIFNPNVHNPFQLDREVLGVPLPGKETLWLDPALRFGEPGLIHPAYQGTPAMAYDPAAWTVTGLTMPVQPPLFNGTEHEFWIDLGGDSEAIRARASLHGYPAWSRRMEMLEKEAKDQEQDLKAALEKEVPGLVLAKVAIQGARDSAQPLAWTWEGTLEAAGGRRRKVEPFPGLDLPIEIPADLRPERKSSIFMPFLCAATAVSHVLLPAGARMVPVPPYVLTTAFGTASVTFTEAPKGERSEVTATLKVTFSRFSSTPQGYAELRRFLAGVLEAQRRAFLVEQAS